MERFRKPIIDALEIATREYQIGPPELETPPDRKMGDFAFPTFRLSKQLKKAPPLIAQELASRVKPHVDATLIEVKSVGPYVNFTITAKGLVEGVLGSILAASKARPYGGRAKNTRMKWVFEFSSPNVAKPFQIYHLRTTIVGSSLSKIARLRGYDVTTINHLGDWGTQYGKLAVALKKYKNELPKELTLKDLVDIYVKIHKDMETDATIEPASREAFLKLEKGDPEMRAIWQTCVDISMKEFKKTYERYQVEFDHYWGESFYEPYLKPLLTDLKTRKIAEQDQGAWIVRATNRAGAEIPPCIVEKSDGATIYATRDIAAAIYRADHLQFDQMSYVVGKEQMLHFEQVFSVLRAMGFSWEKNLEHLATGLYRFKDAKMSTRKGNFVTLEEVTEMSMERSMALMKERNAGLEPEARLNDAELATIAEQVAVGAIVFADLSTDPTRDMEFDVNRVISFEGETGPYLQYAHTRCLSMIRKAENELGKSDASLSMLQSKLTSPFELDLIRTLGRFPEALERTLDQRKPSQLAIYLIDLTRDFGNFYRECKVVNAEDLDLSSARLTLVQATKNVLGAGLDLLGIPKPEKM